MRVGEATSLRHGLDDAHTPTCVPHTNLPTESESYLPAINPSPDIYHFPHPIIGGPPWMRLEEKSPKVLAPTYASASCNLLCSCEASDRPFV